MREFSAFVALSLAASVLLIGCGKTEEAPPAAPAAPPAMAKPAAPPEMPAPAAPKAPATVVDLVASTKADIAKAMSLAQEGKYQEALALLQAKMAEVQSNPEAKKLLDDAIAKIKQMMTEAATKSATEGATKAIGNMLAK
jgi:hypothetical protein